MPEVLFARWLAFLGNVRPYPPHRFRGSRLPGSVWRDPKVAPMFLCPDIWVQEMPPTPSLLQSEDLLPPALAISSFFHPSRHLRSAVCGTFVPPKTSYGLANGTLDQDATFIDGADVAGLNRNLQTARKFRGIAHFCEELSRPSRSGWREAFGSVASSPTRRIQWSFRCPQFLFQCGEHTGSALRGGVLL